MTYMGEPDHTPNGQGVSKAHFAICEDDKCPWKFRGVTNAATIAASETHHNMTGHAVALYDDHTHVGRMA